MNTAIVDDILELKRKKNAIIVAHNYQNPEIQDIADFLGDSLELSKKAQHFETDYIVFCGVRFMAESAKILAPKKKIVLANTDAGCPMADMITAQNVRHIREEYPEHTIVAYVNTSAAVKAEVDICCTSSNALKIVERVDNDKIYFVPDKNLGGWIQRQTKKEMILWQGFCTVHNRMTVEDVDNARKQFPDAVVMVHPEAPLEVLDKADAVLSTGQMVQYAAQSDKKVFIVGTEQGMIYKLKKDFPEKQFYTMGRIFSCANMKKTTLLDVKYALETENNEIVLSETLMDKARHSLDAMLRLS